MRMQVRVKPNAQRQQVEPMPDGSFVIHVQSPPVGGKANQELIELVAQHLRVPKSHVQIRSGANARFKQLDIED